MDTIRSVLQPVTHSLPAPVRDLGVSLLGDACYQALVLDVDETNTACLKLAVSKGLGVGIVAASAVVKVPQMVKLVRSRSAAGVSFLSYLLETTSYLVSLAYNVRSGFPFSTYGETGFLLVQNVAITLLVLHYRGQRGGAAVLAAVLAAAAGALFSEVAVTRAQLGVLQAGAGVLGVASKVPQIAAIWQEGGTGQLSAFTVFNYLVGSLSRIFTTLQEVDDKLILYGFVAGFALNAVLAAQVLYYWNAPSVPSSAAKKGKAKKTATPAKARATRAKPKPKAAPSPAPAPVPAVAAEASASPAASPAGKKSPAKKTPTKKAAGKKSAAKR